MNYATADNDYYNMNYANEDYDDDGDYYHNMNFADDDY